MASPKSGDQDVVHISDEIIQYAAFISSRQKYWTPDLDDLLRKWQKQIAMRQRGHQQGERKYKNIYMGLGIPSIILAAIISAAVFGTFKNCDCVGSTNITIFSDTGCSTDEWIRIISGIIALLSAVLTAVISFVDAGGVKEKHKSIADTYNQLSHQIDTILQTPVILRGDPIAVVQDVRTTFDNTVKDSPYIPPIYETTLTKLSTDLSSVTTDPPNFSKETAKSERTLHVPERTLSVPEKLTLQQPFNFIGHKRMSFDDSILRSLNFELARLNNIDAPEDSEISKTS